MSHELRTPLNSLLILSDQLSRNPEGNLSARQTDFAKTIHSAGNDLLMLINDILDLSKIESGTVVVDVGELRLADLHNYVDRTFRHVAESRGLDFVIEMDPHLPRTMLTDCKRLQQVIKNLLSNAFKFTHHGQVALKVGVAYDGWSADNEALGQAGTVLAFSVSDTGIGIPPDKQHIIFEAFQQADGSTSRKYGGTGLGLAISREISRLLGGEIRLSSAPGRGSTFTLYLPQTYTSPKPTRKSAPGVAEGNGAAAAAAPPPEPAPEPDAEPVLPEAAQLINEVGDDRNLIQPGDRVLLIVENDLNFARFMLDVAREKGFKGLVTSLGAAALAMTREYNPDAITLDIFLPDIDGWRVLERLKNDTATRHIPVCVISTEEARERSLRLGALAMVPKPIKTRETLELALENLRDFVTRPVKELLVVAKDAAKRQGVLDLIGNGDVRARGADTGRAAVEAIRGRQVDCVVLDPDLPDMTVAALAEELAGEPALTDFPVVVYTDKEFAQEDAGLQKLGQAVNLRQARSPERLLDQAALLLHFPVARLPEPTRQVLENLHKTDKVLAGKKVLIVDDDIRNIFALTSVLEWHNMVIVSAETGQQAIDLLQAQPDVDVVLMDIMMPGMDGFETMRAVRQLPQFKNLPIVAVTAKAMKGDREKCIEAGAWDYLSKPVDAEQMLSVLRGWLHR
jgi:CheY-like chemotaxis protein